MKKTTTASKSFKVTKPLVFIAVIVILGLIAGFFIFSSVTKGRCQSNTYKISLDLPANWSCNINNDLAATTSNPATIGIESTNFVVTAGSIGRLFGATSSNPQVMTNEEFFRTADFSVNVFYLNGIVTEIDALPLASNQKDFRIIAKPKITNLSKLDSSQRDELLTIVSAFKGI